MAKFKSFKVLALPDPLEASAVYYVLENDRVTRYVTNKDGEIVAKEEGPMKPGDAISLLDNDAGYIGATFETISKNLEGYEVTLGYTGDLLTTVAYKTGANTEITKTLNYNAEELLESVVLSGDTPAGITLTKTLGYANEVLTSITYS